MNASASSRDPRRDRLVNGAALIVLLGIATLALIGPSSALAWSEDSALLGSHKDRIAKLHERRAELENRVSLLDPRNVDPDFASELVRRDLNVAHPDEFVIELEE